MKGVTDVGFVAAGDFVSGWRPGAVIGEAVR